MWDASFNRIMSQKKNDMYLQNVNFPFYDIL